MSYNRLSTEEKSSSSKVPAYIVTFSDMTTLLLTFFVMLLTLATIQEEGLFNIGKESFLRSLRNLGLGMFYGHRYRPNFGNVKIRYFINTPDKLSKVRSLDAKEEKTRRIFQKVSRFTKTMPSQIVAKKTNFSVTDIHFQRGDATLNGQAKRFLTEFSTDLQQEPERGALRLYVLGLAHEERIEKQRWILSAKRAQAVADFLQSTLPLELEWPIYAWGAGSGGDWVTHNSPVSEQSQVLIAVLRVKD